MEQIVAVTSDRIAVEYGRMVEHGGFERGMMGEVDRYLDKGAKPQADGVRIYRGAIAGDDPTLFERLDAVPARRFRLWIGVEKGPR